MMRIDPSYFETNNHADASSARSEIALWASVMQQGLVDAATCFFGAATDIYERRALRWLMDGDDKFPGSFLWICQTLDLCPERVRSGWRMNVREIATKHKQKDSSRSRRKKAPAVEAEAFVGAVA